MKQNFNYILVLFLFGILLFPKQANAQDKDVATDDLGDVSDAFQEYFFEALKQKGIENYELALEALNKAEKATKDNPENLPVVYFEMAKNQTKLKDFEKAEVNFKKVLLVKQGNLDVMEALYDLYYQSQDYEAAIPLVQKLMVIDEDYKEDLANLYSRTQQYDKALAVLDELDKSRGENDSRDALRSLIYHQTGNTSGQIENLEEKIDKNPKKEQDYLNLIYLYSDQNDLEKAFETAKELLANNPKSELVHFALYKFYLDEDNPSEAIKSMRIVFTSEKIDIESKYKVLGDFIQFTNTNPEYESELEKVVSGFSKDGNGLVYEKLGDYYLAKNRKEEALKFYEKGIKNDLDNFSLLKNTLLLQLEFEKNDEAALLSQNALEIFPSQPILYLLNGVANNNLKNPELAIDSLESGLDYLFENPKMERDFYQQLSKAYSQKGDSEKAKEFAKKATVIGIK